MPVCSLLWFAQLTFWNHYKHVSISPPLQPEFPDSFKKNPTKTNKNQLNGNICLQSHYTEPNPAEPETKAEVTWAAFWSCSAESGHTWGLSSFESISPLPWCSTMGNNYWRNVWLNKFISSLCFYFQKRRGSSVTWLEGKEMQIWKHTCNSPFLLWWKGAGATSYCTTATHCRIKQASLNTGILIFHSQARCLIIFSLIGAGKNSAITQKGTELLLHIPPQPQACSRTFCTWSCWHTQGQKAINCAQNQH